MTEDHPTHAFRFSDADKPFLLRSGETLSDVQIAYQTWGRLNSDKSNAILVFHALSGTPHLSGFKPTNHLCPDLWQPETHQGWWTEFVGSGKAIDTDQFFVICPNYLGGCYGSTGPSDLNPQTGKPYGSTFPRVSTADQSTCAAHLLDHLGIASLHAVVGPSVGGLSAITFATRHPERVSRAIIIASGFQTTVLNRLILFEQILAIENDPYFNGGNYYGGTNPNYGLALARMISHKTFVHLDAIERRARDEIVQNKSLSWYQIDDPFQSYMLHQGSKFVKRFDANTYLRIVDMWFRYKAWEEADAKTPEDTFNPCAQAGHQFLVFSIDSDFCFYPEEQTELVKQLTQAGVDTMHLTVHSEKGHDSFLLEPAFYTPHISSLLNS